MPNSFNVYFGPVGSMSLISSEQPTTFYSLSLVDLDYSIGYQWRIDAINEFGTTTGDTWGFTTADFAPPNPDPDGGYAGDSYMPGGAVTSPKMRLVIAADNKIFYEDV